MLVGPAPIVSEVRSFGGRTDNAQLLADCAQLGYLVEPVLDATYGQGRWWSQVRPLQLYTNDLNTDTDADFHRDFRDMPWDDGQFGTVAFDPPYKLNGTSTGEGPASSDAGYGVAGEYRSVATKMQLIHDGARECARVADRYLLVKCQDQVVSGAKVWQTRLVADFVEQHCGFALADMLHVGGYRKQPPGRRQVHSRSDYSTLLVFKRCS